MTDSISILPGAAAASKSSVPRYLPVILVSCLGIAITVAGFILTERQERNARQSVFDRAASDRISAIESRIEITLGTLKSIRGLYNASTDVQRHEFRAFVDAIEAGAAVQAVEWIPLVTGSDRATF